MDDPRCSSCGAKILWITDQNGTRLPLNKTRVRIYRLSGDEKGEFLTDGVGAGESPMLVHTSHFTTCPHASSHSKK